MLGRGEEIGSLRAVAPPIGAEALVKIFNGIEIIVSEDKMPGHCLGANLAQIERKGHLRRAMGRKWRAELVLRGQSALSDKLPRAGSQDSAMALAVTLLLGAAA